MNSKYSHVKVLLNQVLILYDSNFQENKVDLLFDTIFNRDRQIFAIGFNLLAALQTSPKY